MRKNKEASGRNNRRCRRSENRNSPRELAYSEDFILSCVDKCRELNNYQGLQQFIDVYETVGNVIPVWPGANVHRGQFCCYDCPDIYFNNEKIRDHALAFYNKYSNSYICGDNAIIAGIYNNMSVKSLINMDKDEYENYIEHAINVIKWRTKKNRMIPEDVLESCKYILEMEINYA